MLRKGSTATATGGSTCARNAAEASHPITMHNAIRASDACDMHG